jgi:AAA domain, putative AbiEii toxin, Type IV TA system
MGELDYLDSGSRWHRWDPHIHAPGTVLNNQFSDDSEGWDLYISAIESAVPAVGAVGVTDYYSLKSYERIREIKASGRLSGCKLIFPNIEMRLALGTIKGKFVNVHLLVSPEDPNHIVEINRILSRLEFRAYDDRFSCSEDDLVRLGRLAEPTILDRGKALSYGSEQFKVSLEQLGEIYSTAWARNNILIAVAGGTTDGTSGLREGADKTLREEIEKLAHIIFASSAAQREFWLGLRALSVRDIRERYGSLKPCLHGSDAHEIARVAEPDRERLSWIKGALTFDALRQACIDPSRAYVGEEPPPGATPSQTIEFVSIVNAEWLETPRIGLNPGLVAIIGARGSGKTALADLIASGCDAMRDLSDEQSFIVRARPYLTDVVVELAWADGSSDEHKLFDGRHDTDPSYPRARYLTQQFVDSLCTADGISDALLREIERVIFESHDTSAQDGAIDFDDLLDLRASRFRHSRIREEESLALLSDRVGQELENQRQLPLVRQQVSEKEKTIQRYLVDRQKLVSKGTEDRVSRLEALTRAAEKVRNNIRFFNMREQSLLSMRDGVADFRNNEAPEMLRDFRQRYTNSGLADDEWPSFQPDFAKNVDAILVKHLEDTRKQEHAWKGNAPPVVSDEVALLTPSADLTRQTLALLEAEIKRIQKQVNVDRETANKFTAISRKITEESNHRDRLMEKLKECETARERANTLVGEREEAYKRVFQNIIAEQNVLVDLYRPLMERLDSSAGSLGKLSFGVRRTADVAQWSEEGEELLDFRRLGPFKSRGDLLKTADPLLRETWECGTADDVLLAMRTFLAENQELLLGQSLYQKTDQGYRAWSKHFAKWLYSTRHVSIQYSVDYDGVDIRKLSPGTRGIVLLLLYLALDQSDDRPLIIDQPEENLDPKSIFDELVPLFREAKERRQVIIVTHNANLVVNADADQIIVASAAPRVAGKLPPISYMSGGLESAEVRQAVCNILEGGEHAFRERARRLRVVLSR